MTYVPEDDNGARARGRAILSADMWIPVETFVNPDAVIRMGTLHSANPRGDGVSVNLVRREPHHLVMSRHLHDDWSEKLVSWEVPDFEGAWEVVDFGDRVSLRNPEQERAWQALLLANNGVLNLACGKGKTVLALKKIAQRGHPALVIVNNEGLIDQWISRAREFLSLREDQIGVVQGKTAQWDRPLVIAMIHTLANRAADLPMKTRQRFGTVFFDEVHHLSASTFLRTAPLFYGARYGLTATLERGDGLEAAYYAHVGNPFYTDLQGELTAKVFFQSTNYGLDAGSPEMTDRRGEFSVGKLYTYLANVQRRNEMIVRLVVEALKSGRKMLVLTHSAAHPEILKDLMDRAHPGAWDVGAVSGATPGPDRVRIIREAHVTFATAQVAREALDVPTLDTLMFVTPFKDWGAMQQGKGRIERLYPGKKDPIVVLLDDTGIGPATAMCRSMRRLLRENGYKYANIQPR